MTLWCGMLEFLRSRLWRRTEPARHCPVCGHDVNSFLPIPASLEETARRYGYPFFGKGETVNTAEYSCPRCGASDRERLYALYLNETAASPHFQHRSRLLHFAPEPALRDYILRLDCFAYRTADLLADGVDDHIDITDMATYGDSSFDTFICSHVLEHVANDRLALRELWRILKPGGWGILMAPIMVHLEHTLEDPAATTEAERWRLFGQGDHVRLYAKQDFLYRITSAGFDVEQFGAEHFGADTFTRYGITPGSILYIVRKLR